VLNNDYFCLCIAHRSCNPQTVGQTEQQLPALDVSLLVPPAAQKLGSSAGAHLNSRSAPSGLLLRHQHAQEAIGHILPHAGHILPHAAAAAHDRHGSGGAQPSTVQDQVPAAPYSKQQQHLQLQVVRQQQQQQQQPTKEQQQQHRALHKGQELLLPEITSLKERQSGLQNDVADTSVLSATKQPHLQQQAQQRQGQQQQPAKQQQQEAGEDGSDAWARPPPPPPYTLHSPVNPVCSEYHMPPHSVSAAPTASLAGATSAPTVAAAIASDAGIAVSRRRLTQLAPTNCGKLGTYVPNYYMGTDGSMFGVSIAPNVDGSVIAVGSPINGPDAKDPGGASVLTSWSDQTCEYAVVPVWQPEGCYKYFGAQVRHKQHWHSTQACEGSDSQGTAGSRTIPKQKQVATVNGSCGCACRITCCNCHYAGCIDAGPI